MISFDRAREKIVDIMKGRDFEIHQELLDNGITFSHSQIGVFFTIGRNIIEKYSEIHDNLNNITSNCTFYQREGFCEQLIEGSRDGLPVRLTESERDFVFEAPNGVRVEVGRISIEFICLVLVQDESWNYVFERIRRIGYMRSRESLIEDAVSRLATIKYYSPDQRENLNIENVISVFESCLFDLCFIRNRSIEIVRFWPVLDRRVRRIGRPRQITEEVTPIRSFKYNAVILNFYRRGVVARDSFIQFVSFYHVIEFFFLRVSDHLLYKKMGQVMADPTFRPNPRSLDRLITAVEEHKRDSDETEMLKNTLKEYVNEDELIEFIKDVEVRLSEPIYTNKYSVFGENFEKINLQQNHVFGTLSKRIKTI